MLRYALSSMYQTDDINQLSAEDFAWYDSHTVDTCFGLQKALMISSRDE